MALGLYLVGVKGVSE